LILKTITKNNKLISKPFLWLMFFSLLGRQGNAQPEFQFGLMANPLLSWMKAESSEIEKGSIRGGLEYGLMMDINFTGKYILATGISATLAGGNLIYTDSILTRYPGDSLFFGDVSARFKLQSLNLPLVFKMRTRQIGIFRYYGGLGLIPAFRFKARADAEANGIRIFDNDNIVKNKDQTGGVFQSTFFNLCLHAEAGIEYPFSDNTSLVAGIFYRHGFVNVLKDGDEDRVSLSNLGLRLGVIF